MHPEPPAPPAPEQPEATSVKADFADDEVVASDHTETTIMDAADMELEEVVKPVVTSTSPVGVERLDHLATADSADLAPVAPAPLARSSPPPALLLSEIRITNPMQATRLTTTYC